MNYYRKFTKTYRVKFFVNEDKNIVVCKLEDWNGNEYMGKSQCSPLDIFDVRTGKVVAYRRARRAMMLFVKRELQKIINEANTVLTIVTKDAEDCRQIIAEATNFDLTTREYK